MALSTIGTNSIADDAITIDKTSGVGLILGTTVATTSGTAIDFTSIPSGVKRISMAFNQVSCNGTAPRLIQIGTSDGLVTFLRMVFLMYKSGKAF